MKILVSGPTTYLSRQLVKHLADIGHEIHFSEGATANLDASGNWDWHIDGGIVYPVAGLDRRPVSLNIALGRLKVMRKRYQRYIDMQIAR